MKKNLTVEETFDLAVKSYQEKKFHTAEKLYKEVLKNSSSRKLRASMYSLEELHPTCQKCQSRVVEI